MMRASDVNVSSTPTIVALLMEGAVLAWATPGGEAEDLIVHLPRARSKV